MYKILKSTFNNITQNAKGIAHDGREIKVHGTHAFGNLKFYNKTDGHWIDNFEWAGEQTHS